MSSHDDYVELVEKAGKLGATARLDYAHIRFCTGCSAFFSELAHQSDDYRLDSAVV